MDKNNFAKQLIELRKRKGFTQQELADLLQVSNKAISRWETGEGYPDITTLKPLSDALGASCDELLSDQRNYSDIKRSDLQKYLPYILVVASLFVYYSFLKLGVPHMIALFTLIAGFGSACYLMIHHTDKEHFATLLKLEGVLLYFPFINFLMSIFLVSKFIQYSYGEMNMLNLLLTSGIANTNIEENTGDIFGEIMGGLVGMYIISAIIVISLYYIVKYYVIKRYHITWSTLVIKKYKKNKKI